MEEIPDIHFGSERATDWRKVPDPDPDDEPLPETPPEIVAVLGFDPRDEPADETPAE